MCFTPTVSITPAYPAGDFFVMEFDRGRFDHIPGFQITDDTWTREIFVDKWTQEIILDRNKIPRTWVPVPALFYSLSAMSSSDSR